MTEYQRDIVEALTDKDLIGELRRRGRLLVVEASGQYYTDLRDDESYMRHCDEQIVRIMTATLRTKLIAEFKDRKVSDNEHVAIRKGSIVVLLSREQAELERHEAAKSIEAVSGVHRAA